jgi:formamidopyrimidine-DNA glycosylase
MPELPEVEYFRKRWDPGIGGQIVAVELHATNRVFRGSNVRALARRLVRQRLLRSQARGKQMLFEFSGHNWLGIHLGMSGKLRIESTGFVPGKHDHLVLKQKERALVFSDVRQFGRVRYDHGETAPEWWESSSPEIGSPEFTKAAMRAFIARHARAPIKAVLLLQKGFPGVGNWMADEILWRARIAPRISAGKLSSAKLEALWRSTRFVASASLKTIGQDFSEPPKTWLLHERWKRDGKCPRHGIALRRATIGGRTTAWCPRCQRKSRSS